MSKINGVIFKVCKSLYKNLQLNLKENWQNKVKMAFYAVANGRTTGIFETWADCEAQIKGFSGARYKKFNSAADAQEFISTYNGSNASTSNNKKNYGNSSNNNLKRSYSTSSSNYQRNNQSTRKLHSGSTSRYEHEDTDSSQFEDSTEDLDVILHKQMDDIEKRLKSFSKGVDKIIKKGTKEVGRSTILIEPPQHKRAKKNSSNFEEDSQGYIQVYTDGACSSNGRKGARAGIGVYWGNEHSMNVSEPVQGRATNNCGEIQAATRAIKQAVQNGIKKLAINTDSQFLINSITKWMPGWKRKGWKLASGEPVKNEVDFKDLDSVLQKIDIKWNYVEAHRGVHGNEMADALAKTGAAMYSNK